jgi:nicotinate-nucleotide adenylyltransferase
LSRKESTDILSITMFIIPAVERLEDRVRRSISEKRFAHSVGTAALARELAARWGEDGDDAYLAGMTHDMCKELDPAQIVAIAARDGRETPVWFENRPKLLHGRAAAVILSEEYGIRDSDVLEAVRDHTFGAPSMGNLARIVFCADKLEPGRERDAFGTAALACLTLDGMLAMVVGDRLSYLRSMKRDIAPPTLALYLALGGGAA